MLACQYTGTLHGSSVGSVVDVEWRTYTFWTEIRAKVSPLLQLVPDTVGEARRGAGTGVPGPEEGVIELVNLANAGNLSAGYLPHPKITVAATCPRT